MGLVMGLLCRSKFLIGLLWLYRRTTKHLSLSSSFTESQIPLFVSLASSNSKARTVEGIMDPAEMRYLEEEDGPMMKTMKGSVTGFGAGTIYGTILATWKDVPRVERNVALPGLIRTLKMMGSHGLTFAAIGGVYIGVEQLVQHYRSKRDFFNGAIGGFVAGASVLGYRARSIPTAISAGAALAVTSALIDSGGQTTRVDTGREYYPYTVEKRAEADS